MSDSPSKGLLAVRYGVPAVIAAAGAAYLVIDRSLTGLEGFALAIGVAGSILLLNVLYRVGVSGDIERDREAQARDFFDEHGHWPDEQPPERPRSGGPLR